MYMETACQNWPLQRGSQGGLPLTYSGEVIREFPLLVAHGDIGPMEDEEGAELCAALLSRLVERCKVPAIRGIHQAVVLDQHGRHIHMLKGRTD